jgi:hypothetical protein
MLPVGATGLAKHDGKAANLQFAEFALRSFLPGFDHRPVRCVAVENIRGIR